jgi:DNA-binding protein HU-beta
MSRDAVIAAVATKTGETKKQVEQMLTHVFDAIAHELSAGGEVKVTGFGTFKTKHRAERSGVNPATKEPITIKAKTVAAFSPASKLSELVNSR